MYGMERILKLIIWPLSILILIVGLLLTFAYPKSALLMIFSGLIIFPPFWKIINKRVSFKVPGLIRVILFVAVLIFSFETLPPSAKTVGTKISNQTASPTPIAQTEQTKQESESKNAMQDATTVKETAANVKKAGDMAEAYCNERRNTTRLYTVLELSDGADGKAELKPETTKQGENLTSQDCVKAITALTFAGYADHIEDIVNQRYWQNMNQFEANYSLGIPDDKSKTTESGFLVPDETESWSYYGSNGQKLFLYFKNGLLTKWTQNY